MQTYSAELIISISIRIIAFIWSILLLKKIKDWRMSLLTLMLFLMTVQQFLRLYAVKSELPGLIVSILALLAVIFVGKLIIMLRINREELKNLNEKLEHKVEERTAELNKKNLELEEALSQVKTLSGMLPICASCKKIRNDQGYWEQIEQYIGEHSEAVFTHGICPDCVKRLYPDVSLKDIK